MLYFVIHPSGQRFGPADVPTLSQWAAEGRLLPTSLVAEESTGRQLQAYEVPGIQFGAPGPGQHGPGQYGQPGYGQPSYGQPGYGQGMGNPTTPYSLTGNNSPNANTGFGNPGNPYATPSPYGPYSNVPADGVDQLNHSYILSSVAIGLNLLCCVPILGVVGILCAIGGLITAIIAHSKGLRAGSAIALAIVALVIPFAFWIIGSMLMNSLKGG